MSTARKVLSNTAWQIASKFLIALLGIITLKQITNYLPRAVYGEYTFIFQVLNFAGIAADLGIYTIAVKEMSKDESQTENIIGNILTLRIILVSLILGATAITGILMAQSGANNFLAFGITLASATVFLGIINGTLTSVLQAKFKMHIASILSVIGKAITLGLMLYIIFIGFPIDASITTATDFANNPNVSLGFFGLLLSGVVGNLVMLSGTIFYVSRITKIRFKLDKKLCKDILKKSLPYGIAMFLSTVYLHLDSILLRTLLDPTIAKDAVAIYGVPIKLFEQLTVLPVFLMNSVLPVLTVALEKYKKTQENLESETNENPKLEQGIESDDQSENHKPQTIIRYSFDLLAVMAIPLVVGGFVLAYPIVSIISDGDKYLSNFSEGFYGSDVALKILIFAIGFQFLNVLFSFILIALNRQKKLLYISLATALTNGILNVILIPKYGFVAAAATSVLSEILVLILTFHYAKKYLHFSINLKNLFKIILSALVMGVLVYALEPYFGQLLKNYGVLLLILIAVLVYVAMLFLTRVVNRKMLKMVLKKK